MKKTVFVIGAGASAELRLPTGYELKNKISSLVNYKNDYDCEEGDHLINKILNRKNDILYFEACEQICNSMILATSIDNFLYDRGDDPYIVACGKLAIVRAILQAEYGSIMTISPGIDVIDFLGIEKTWLTPFFQFIRENCRNSQDLVNRFSEITLVIFNYDRCVEFYLYNALKKYYKLTSEETALIINKMEIYHPYGSVGALPWQKSSTKISIKFGYDDPSGNELEELSNNIRTFTEQIDEADEQIKFMQHSIKYTERIVFLGFGYHSLNKRLLFPSANFKTNRILSRENMRVYGTAYKMPYDKQNHVRKYLQDLFDIDGENIKLTDDKCYYFFQKYPQGLSFVQ